MERGGDEDGIWDISSLRLRLLVHHKCIEIFPCMRLEKRFSGSRIKQIGDIKQLE